MAVPGAQWPVRLLAGLPLNGSALLWNDHLRIHGARPVVAAKQRGEPPLLAIIARAGIRGRGGAGFPLAAKLRAVRLARGRPTVVLNAAEGEPASHKDAVLATQLPHLPLDGAQLAAELIDAVEIIIWRHRKPRAEDPLAAALRERQLAKADAIPCRIVDGPARYVAGETSALTNYLSGGPAKPTSRQPGQHATERGIRGKPTLVSNAETLAQLALVARHGADWYRSVGTPEEPGTLLLTVRGVVQQSGVVEVPFGTIIGDAIAACGGVTHPPQAVLVGGYAGSWLPAALAWSLSLATPSLASVGAGIGVGLLAVLPTQACGLIETTRIISYLAAESAGQCGPCLNGLPAMAEELRRLMIGQGDPRTVERLERLSSLVIRRGSCHHPDGAAQLITSALRTFRGHAAEHLAIGSCPAVTAPAMLPIPRVAAGQWR
jgi:NADH:ubiquinone oxidoreductase subunit F (NADH-binding)